MASRTLEDPLGWANSTVLKGDALASIAALKGEPGDPLHVIGSTDLARQLVRRDLVDEFRLIIDPVIVGGGKGVFPDDGTLRSLRLVGSQTTTTGAHLATFAAADA